MLGRPNPILAIDELICIDIEDHISTLIFLS